MKNKKRGFTLVELLAVLVILALITFLAVRSIKGSINKARSTMDENTEKDILDAAEKWSIENSDKFDDGENTIISVGLDIVFIVDMSKSMYICLDGTNANSHSLQDCTKHGGARYEAAAEAINNAVQTLRQNEKSKIDFVFYNANVTSYSQGAMLNISNIQSVTHNHEKLPAQCYDCSKGYINIIRTNNSSQSFKMAQGTNTTDAFKAAINKFSGATDRFPVVILLTDGEANYLNGRESSDYGNVGKVLIKSYVEGEKTLKQKYNDSKVFIYTIGLGVESKFGQFTINPKYADAPNMNTNSESMAKQLYDKYLSKQEAIDDKYEVITKSFSGNMSAEELNRYFASIAKDVQAATEVKQVCVSISELYENGYLSKEDIKLNNGESVKNSYVVANYNEATNQYKYSIDYEGICKKNTSS